MAAPQPSIRTARVHPPALERQTTSQVIVMLRGMRTGRSTNIQPSAACPPLDTAPAWLSAQTVASQAASARPSPELRRRLQGDALAAWR